MHRMISTAVMLALLSLTQPASGTVRYVNRDVAESGDGLSWGNAIKFLQDAIDASSAGDDIWVKQGLYKPSDSGSTSFVLRSGVKV